MTSNSVPDQKYFLGGVFLICMCGLMLQIMQTRILSIISYYHMAFFAIGMAMMGMTAGALLVYYEKLPSARSLSTLMARVTTLFAWSTVLSLIMLLSTTLTPHFEPTLKFVAVWAVGILVLLPPYVLLGVVVSLALTRSPFPVGRVYGVDLLGAATGCLATLLLLSFLDTYSAVIVVAVVGAVAALMFGRADRVKNSNRGDETAPPFLSPSKALIALAALAILNITLGTYGLRPGIVKGFPEAAYRLTEERWNSFSRISVRMSPKLPAFMWSASTTAPQMNIEQGWLTIDGEAGTPIYRFTGDMRDIEFLRYDATAFAYSIRHEGRSAVIGTGGGRDLLTASLVGFKDVTGVEYNPIFVRLFSKDYVSFSGADRINGLRLFVDDARSWFARSNEQFDLIQMSLIDTWAATGAGAFTLSENGLYTVDGWKRFMARLSPNGVFTVSRWFSPENLDETGRILSLAMATLIESGVPDPAAHIFLIANKNLSTIIVSKAPLTADDLSTLRTTAQRFAYTVLVDPASKPVHPVFAMLLGAHSTRELVQIGHQQSLDLSPTWDRNPFFFNQIRFDDPLSLLRKSATMGMVARGNLTATLTLVSLIMLSMVFTAFVVLLPAARSLKQIELPVVAWGSAFFLLIGFGFMFAEIGLIQRMSIFLGHPVYGLAIVLFGIILFTGVGSLVSERLMRLAPWPLIGWPIALALYLAALPLWLPNLMHAFESASLVERVGVCLTGMVPCGVLMGLMFPTGMRLIGKIDLRPTPWLWAINGAAGVLGSGAAVLFSMQTSLDATLVAAAVFYALVSVAAFSLGKLSGFAKPV